MKKVVSLIDLKEMKTRNGCEVACDCVKRAHVFLHVGLCKEVFARKHTATHKPTSAQPHIARNAMTRTQRLLVTFYSFSVDRFVWADQFFFCRDET